MNVIQDDVNAQISIILNKKRCLKCLKQYSSNSVLFEITEDLKIKSSLFSAKTEDSIHIRKGSYNRLIGSQPRVVSYEPCLSLNIICQCGHCSYVALKTKNN